MIIFSEAILGGKCKRVLLIHTAAVIRLIDGWALYCLQLIPQRQALSTRAVCCEVVSVLIVICLTGQENLI